MAARIGSMMFFFLFISVFYVIGIGLMWAGIASWRKAHQAKSWPTVDGSFKECKLETDDDTQQVKVRYIYLVDGLQREGTQIAFGYCGSNNHAEHEAILDKLQAAKTVTVRYNPAAPDEAVLAAGFNRSIFLILAFATTWLSFVIGFTVLWVTFHGVDSTMLNQIQTVP
mgnify:CR=1 FL=1